MRIAAMGAGAVAGYFAARLAAAGHEVSFIARGAHLTSIRQHGLRIESALGDLLIEGAKATANPSDVGSVDIVLFAVKLWDSEVAAEAARPMVSASTRVITLQNGVDSVERLRPILGEEQVIGGTSHLASVIASPGVIRQTSGFAQIRFGRTDGHADPLLQTFATAARAAGIDVSISDNIDLDRWKKFVFLVGLSGATAAMRQPLGAILADAQTREFFVELMREVVAVGQACGIPLSDDFVTDRLKFADEAPYGFKASMLHDLERGNRLELDWLAGKVVELGRQHGIPTPANRAAYLMLKLHRGGAS